MRVVCRIEQVLFVQERVFDDWAPYLEIVETSFLLCMNENVVDFGHVYGHRVTSSLGRDCRRWLFWWGLVVQWLGVTRASGPSIPRCGLIAVLRFFRAVCVGRIKSAWNGWLYRA